MCGKRLKAAMPNSLARYEKAAHNVDAPHEREKCYGVAKAEKNDCSAKDGSYSCAGLSKKERNENT